jgi:glycosyl transferase family 25
MKPGLPEDLKVLLINLERSVTRRESMEQRLREIGLEYEIVPAIDGKLRFSEIIREVDETAFVRNVGRPLLAGEIGCYLSHLEAWQRLLDGPADVLLVLEDDVVFHEDFVSALEIALEHTNEWDLPKLNKIRAKQPIRQRTLGPYALNAYVGPATGTGAYLIQRRAINKLLPVMKPITRPIDHELDRIHVHDIRLFGLEPFPSHVDDGQSSTITGKAFSSVKKFKWYQRLPLYGLRLSNLTGKILYLHRNGRLYGGSKRAS